MGKKIKDDPFTKEELEKFYMNHSYTETCEHFNIKGGVLDRRLRFYGIKKEKAGERTQNLISEATLRDLYLEQNLSMKEICNMFSVTGAQLRQLIIRYKISKPKEKTKEVTKRLNLQKYGFESTNSVPEIKERKRQSYQERYGVDNPLLIPEVLEASLRRLKDPEIQRKRLENFLEITPEQWQGVREKAIETLKERYGENYAKAFAEKAKQTYLEKYGVPYSVEGHKKAKKTCLEKYGTEYSRSSEEVKARIRKTKMERYGSFFNLEKVRKTKEQRYGDPNYNNREKARRTNRERFGVDWFCMSPEAATRYKSADSRPNLRFKALLETNNILDYEREFPIGNRSYDFKVGNKLIEINPYATHNSTWGIGKDKKGKEPTYHRDKTELARENGYQCIHVFDWDDWDKVIKLLLPKQTLYARKLELREIQQLEANRFLKEHHLQGGAKLQTVCLGLFEGQELIEVMTFGKPRFNRKYQWELIRLCTKSGYCVVGGAERLFKAFIRLQQPESIISYCDDAKFNGNVYTRLGFNHQSTGAISKHWFNPETGVHVTDNGLRMKGFDKLFGEIYGKFGKGTSNEDLMREHGFLEVYDAGQSVYTWQSQPNPLF